MTTFIYIDRRQAAKGKSAGNRQKLLRRIKESIRAAMAADTSLSAAEKETVEHLYFSGFSF
jgi:uncharacterized sporulation protein YeaH/YhbH (DUF444 family)